MPLDRTFFNTLVDDDGTNTVGTPVTTAFIGAIYNDIDAVVEGTATVWTPTDASGAGLTLTNGGSWYLKTGRLVFLSLNVVYPSTVNGSTAKIGGLPFAVNASVMAAMVVGFSQAAPLQLLLRNGASVIEPYGAVTPKTNADLSTVSLYAAGTYLV